MRVLSLISLVLFSTSCIEEVEIPIKAGKQLLVVDGFITTDPGPHRIRLTRSATYGSVFDGEIRTERQAQVILRDSKGNLTFLTENSPGSYFTGSNFTALVGETYTLQIFTRSNEEFLSLPQTVLPPIPVDSVLVRFKKLPSENPLGFRSGMEIYTQFEDAENDGNLYMWDIDGIYERSGCFIADRPLGVVNLVGDSDFDQPYQTRLVGFIEDDGRRFSVKYFAEVNQYSVSPEIFSYVRTLNRQFEVSGGIFDPPPSEFFGNMINVNDANEKVLGFFGAYGVSKKGVFISPQDLDEKQRAIQNLGPCTALGNVISKPSFWN